MEKLKLRENYVNLKKEFKVRSAIYRTLAKEIISKTSVKEEVIIDMKGVDMVSRSFIDEVIFLTNNNVKFINVAKHLKGFFDFEERIIKRKIKVEYV